MARIAGVPARQAGVGVKLAYHFTRRALRKLAGRETDQMLEPLSVLAHSPKLLAGYGRLEQALAKLHHVDRHLSDLAELKAATMMGCEYCIDLGSQIARRRSGISDEQLKALPHYRDSSLFSELEKLVLDYAVGLSRTPVDVSDDLFAKLREHFDDAQLVELTYVVAHENTRGRFNHAFEIGSAGFSTGLVCAVPLTAEERPQG
ncbi:MAG: carboxymuconolactone decarboxylase family protein [Mycobacterium sp.]|nr:carboxymuconolactone decarboxylase family protein [Mycobacterium sp.]